MKQSSETETLFWKSMLWESSSSEKVTAIESSVFWKVAALKR